MGVIKNKLRSKFSTLPNEIIEDVNVSNGAFRVYCYISSKEDGWKVRNKDIQKRLGIKQAQTLANYYSELIERGWIERERAKDENGNFVGGFDYHIMEKPYYGKTIITEKPQLRKNHTHSNTDLISNTNNDNNTEVDSTVKILNGYLFEDFWSDYDKKVGVRDRIKKKFEKLNESTREKIKLFVAEYKIAQPEKQYRKNPETFLNQKSWEDELIYNKLKNGKSTTESSRLESFFGKTA